CRTLIPHEWQELAELKHFLSTVENACYRELYGILRFIVLVRCRFFWYLFSSHIKKSNSPMKNETLNCALAQD
ncbi:MAG: hypothetical protein OEU74_10480, partial [Gammaproteobacteria bacterium]|nr:hypothetical protein [Gammaproteobacteria bacterium]